MEQTLSLNSAPSPQPAPEAYQMQSANAAVAEVRHAVFGSVSVELAHGDSAERRTQEVLRSLFATYDLSPYLITRQLRIEAMAP
jgi:hypothetical protein